jgi:hypothetical protein
VNCLAFRRQLLIDPQGLKADLTAHSARCAGCARALQRAMAFETSLKAALLIEYAGENDAHPVRKSDDKAAVDPTESVYGVRGC